MGRNLNQIYSTNPLTTFQSGDLFYVVRGTTNCATTFDSLETAFGGGGGVATEITVANEQTDTTCFPLFVTEATGDLGPKSNAGLSFNSATGNLIVTGGITAESTASSFSTINADSVNATTLIGELQQNGNTLNFTANVTLGGTGAAFTTTGTSGITLAAPSTGSPIVYTLPSTAATLADASAVLALAGGTMTGNITMANGSAAAPAIRVTAAANGLYHFSNSILGVSIGGALVGGFTSAALMYLNGAAAGLNLFTDLHISRFGSGVAQIGTSTTNASGALMLTKLVLGGNAEAGASTQTTLTKLVSSIADNTATAVLTVTIPNAAHAATVRVTMLGRLGAGGAIGADEATGTVSYDVSVARTAGVNAVATISTAYGSATSSVAGAATITVTGDLSVISGAVGASNTFTVRVTIARGSGSSANHTCTLVAQVLNANATGISIA